MHYVLCGNYLSFPTLTHLVPCCDLLQAAQQQPLHSSSNCQRCWWQSWTKARQVFCRIGSSMWNLSLAPLASTSGKIRRSSSSQMPNREWYVEFSGKVPHYCIFHGKLSTRNEAGHKTHKDSIYKYVIYIYTRISVNIAESIHTYIYTCTYTSICCFCVCTLLYVKSH